MSGSKNSKYLLDSGGHLVILWAKFLWLFSGEAIDENK
jgi:hypothetical protein